MKVEILSAGWNGRRRYIAAMIYSSFDLNGAAQKPLCTFISKSETCLVEFMAMLKGVIEHGERGEHLPPETSASRSLAALPEGWVAWRCDDIYVHHHAEHGFGHGIGDSASSDNKTEWTFAVVTKPETWNRQLKT